MYTVPHQFLSAALGQHHFKPPAMSSYIDYCKSLLFGLPISTLDLFKLFFTQQLECPLERQMLYDITYV